VLVVDMFTTAGTAFFNMGARLGTPFSIADTGSDADAVDALPMIRITNSHLHRYFT